MKLTHSLKLGINFGLTSGIITTLGLMVGLASGTHSKLAVIGGILTIAIADAFSDALGIHVSEEAECEHTSWEVWQSTLATFLAKFLFALIFVIPVLLLNLYLAVGLSAVFGLSVLGVLSYQMGRQSGGRPWQIVLEHLLIGCVVVLLTYYVGMWIAKFIN